jgi:hypothetical protein
MNFGRKRSFTYPEIDRSPRMSLTSQKLSVRMGEFRYSKLLHSPHFPALGVSPIMKNAARLCLGRSLFPVVASSIRTISSTKLFCIIILATVGLYCLPIEAQTAHAGGALPIGSGFSSPNGVAADGSGNVFVASQGDNAVYEIVAVDGVILPSSEVKTIGSGFTSPNGVAVDGSGNVFVADSGNSAVKEIVAVGDVVSSSSAVNTIGSGFNQPQGVTVDGNGNVFVADSGSGAVKEIVAVGGVVSSSSVVNAIGSGFSQPTDVAVDGSGNVFVADYNNSAVYEVIAVGGVVSSSSTVNTIGSGFTGPNGLTVDGSGNVFVADYGNNAVKEIIAVGGTVSAGSTVNTLGSGFNGPTGVAVDGLGNVFIADQGSSAMKEIVTGARRFPTTAVAGTGVILSIPFTFDTGGSIGAPMVLTQGAAGLDFTDAGTGSCTTNGTSYAYAAGDTCTVDVTFTPKLAGTRYGAAVLQDGSGNTIATGYIYGAGQGPQIAFSPGTQRTLGSGFNAPQSVAVDGSGNVYVIDSGTVNQIAAVGGVIPASPAINTLGSGFNAPQSVAVDGSGNVYVADTGNGAVKEIVAVGGAIPASPTIRTLGSGFSFPYGVAVDRSGNVYVVDLNNNAVKEIVAVGGVIPASPTIRTLGSGFNSPFGVAVDGRGNVYVADNAGAAVKMLDVADAPALSFASTVLGATSTDSPQTVTVENIGNAHLSFLVPATGNNPSIATGFTLGNSGTCPQLSTSSSVATLAQGTSCTMLVSFSPTAVGSNSGSLILTDDALNASPSTTQTIGLSGTATAPGPATHFSVTGPNPAPFYTAFSITITALDASGNVAIGYNGTVTTTSSDPGYVSPGLVTLTNGVATATVALKTAGTDTVTATDTTNSSLTGTGSFTVYPGPATGLGAAVPATATAGTPISLTINVRDFYGNLATSYTGTVHFTSSDSHAALPGDYTFTGGDNGTHTFSVTLTTPGSQTITATDSVNSLSATSDGITVTAPNFVVTTAGDGIAPAINLTGPLQSYDGDPEIDGFAFQATKNVTVSSLGIFAGPSLPLPASSSVAVGLWTDSGTLLASTTVTSSDTAIGSFYYHPITPVALTAGQSYVVGAQMAGSGVLTYYGGAYTMADGIQYVGSRYDYSSSLVMPTSYDGTPSDPGYIGASFLVGVGGSGVASDCTPQTTPGIGTDAGCSLRDALLAAANSGAGNITFDATAFATAKTIGLGSGTLTLPSNTAVQGRTTGSGALLTNLVTVSGGGSAPVFTVGSGVVNASLSNLVITGGNSSSGGGGIYNDGVLTVSNSTISGNKTSSGEGGGILNLATLAVKNSSITGNTVASIGAGLYNPTGSTATLINSTISGNTAPASGGGIYNNGGTLVITGSTVSGNSVGLTGGGILSPSGSLTVANSIVAGNSATTNADISGSYTDGGGNIASSDSSGTSAIAINLAPLGSYGGPLQTILPLPGSPAICAAVIANIPGGITTDERGFARTTTYGSTPCADSGAAQSSYAVSFGTQPSNVLQNTAMSPAPTVALTESGVPFMTSSVSIPLSLAGTGALSGASASTSGGVATYSALKVNAGGTGDTLVANLVLNSVTATTLSVASNSFNVTSAVTQLAFGTSPASTITAGGNAGSAVTVKEEGSDSSLVATAADSITLSVTGPASYTKSYTVTAVNGVATFDLSGDALTAAGSYGYTASLTGVSSATSSATVSADSANAISAISGSGQSAVIGAAFANPLSVKVVDAYNNPVSGATVTFTAPGSGAGATFSTAAATASDGTTSATATANGTAGATAYAVTANVVGATTPASFTLTNTKASTSVTVTPLATSIVYGQPVTINAAVTPGNVAGSVPSGSVTFYDGATALAPDSSLTGAAASYTVSVPTVGSRTYGAQYAGDTNFLQSSQASAASPVVIGKASSTLTPATTSETLAYNVGGTISVSVAGQFSGSGITQPTGSITYTIGSGLPQSAAITAGSAIVTIPAVQAAGAFTIAVNYAGDGNYNPAAAATIALTVNQAAGTVALGNLSASYDGNVHAATATTTPGGLAVTFTYNGVSTAPTAAGIYTVVGTIDDLNYQGSASGTLTIGKSDPVVTWTVPPAIGYGTALTAAELNATALVPGTFAYSPAIGTVLAVGGQTLHVTFTPTDDADYATATGSVALTVNAATLVVSAHNATRAYGAANPSFIGTVSGAANGDIFTESFATTAGTSSPVGSYAIVPSVTGANLSSYTQSVTNGVLTVTQAASSTVLTAAMTASGQLLSVGDGATFIATVASSTSGTPTGVVMFFDGTTALGSVPVTGGVASYSTSSLSAGPHTISASYAGDSNFTGSTSNPVNQTVSDFTLSFSSPQTILPGHSATFTLTATPAYGAYNQSITFAASGLPAGATATFSSTSLTPGSKAVTATLTIQVPSQSAQRGLSSGTRYAVPVLFGFLLPLAGMRRGRRKLKRYGCLLLFAVLSFGVVTGLSGCGSGGFFNQMVQTYNVTVTGTSGTVQHSASVALTVQ